jgi:hypothetical protein
MKIALKHGWCLIDDEDWHGKACMWTWRSALSTVRGTNGRVARTAYVIGHPLDSYHSTQLEMHRFLLGLPPYRERHIDVDHLNGDGLDNRRVNLRIGSRAQNLANSGSRKGTSRFKGVSFDRRTGHWKVQIMTEGRNRNLGRYETEEEAALVYNAAAREAWGEFTFQNKVE